jgi:hypothetical protein
MTHPANTTHAQGPGAFGFARDGYYLAQVHDLKTSDIDGAKVHDRSDDSIGSVTELKVGRDGQISHAIIDVGGFLGMGAHSVLLPFSQLTVLRKTGGNDVRVHLDITKDQLKAMPHHKS